MTTPSVVTFVTFVEPTTPNTTVGIFSTVNKLDDIEFSYEEKSENSQLKSQQLH